MPDTPQTESFLLNGDGEAVFEQLERLDRQFRETIADSQKLDAFVREEMQRRGSTDYPEVLGEVLATARATKDLVAMSQRDDVDREKLALAGAAQLREAGSGGKVTFSQALREIEGGRS
jgi:hypothetical protein